jgi:hypothetical protein
MTPEERRALIKSILINVTPTNIDQTVDNLYDLIWGIDEKMREVTSNV